MKRLDRFQAIQWFHNVEIIRFTIALWQIASCASNAIPAVSVDCCTKCRFPLWRHFISKCHDVLAIAHIQSIPFQVLSHFVGPKLTTTRIHSIQVTLIVLPLNHPSIIHLTVLKVKLCTFTFLVVFFLLLLLLFHLLFRLFIFCWSNGRKSYGHSGLPLHAFTCVRGRKRLTNGSL